jgi:protein-tyrosine phosphatase
VSGIVTDVAVVADGRGGLSVSWQLDGGDRAVDVAAGPTPDTVDHVHSITMPAGQRQVRLDVPAAQRWYVSVSPHDGGAAVVAAERRLPFEGVLNFRDLGGYQTADGRRTRWGRIFRADALHGLTPSDRAIFESLKLRVIYDLRSDLEREQKPNSVPPPDGLRSVPLPLISSRQADLASIAEQVKDGEGFLLHVYRGMIAQSAPVFGQLLTGLTEDSGLPAVFHCAAGKDRTGTTAAILLSALGVDDDDILDDYELTSRHRTEERRREVMSNLEQFGLSPEIAAGLLHTPRWVMATVLEEIRSTYGDVEGYLTGPVGMTDGEVARLRRLLVD